MFRIERDINGVPGLHIGYEMFSVDLEKELFTSEYLYPYGEGGTKKQNDAVTYLSAGSSYPTPRDVRRRGKNDPETTPSQATTIGPTAFPNAIFELLSAVEESGLFNDMCPPSYCLSLNYPKGSHFGSHFDSRYCWGEVVMGVNLGGSAVMLMTPHHFEYGEWRPSGEPQRIFLPRRSIYVMSSQSRISWQHFVLFINILPWYITFTLLSFHLNNVGVISTSYTLLPTNHIHTIPI